MGTIPPEPVVSVDGMRSSVGYEGYATITVAASSGLHVASTTNGTTPTCPLSGMIQQISTFVLSKTTIVIIPPI